MILLWTEWFFWAGWPWWNSSEYPTCFWGHGGKWWSRWVWSHCICLGELKVHVLEFPSLYNSGLDDTGYLQDIWWGWKWGSSHYDWNTGTEPEGPISPRALSRIHRLTFLLCGSSKTHMSYSLHGSAPSASLRPGQAHVWLHSKGSRWNGRQTWLPGWPPSLLLWVHIFFWII